MPIRPVRLILCLACAAGAATATTDTGTLYRGPYLQQASAGSVVVVWRTQGKTVPVVRYGATPDALTSEVSGSDIVLRVSEDVDAPSEVPRLYKEPAEDAARRKAGNHDPSTASNTYQYEAHISGLAPNSKHYYAVFDGDRELAGGDSDHYFVTHRPIGSKTDMRLWVVGDSGTGDENQAKVHDAMRAYTAATHRSIDHYIHVGDMAYGDGTDWQFQHNFFEPYQATLQNTVVWPAMGNHEGHTSRGISGYGPYYDAYVVPMAGEVGGAPSGTEAYYSFDISEVHFICLDSHDLDRSLDAPMAQWLRADLEQVNAKWLIAFWHHPPYTKGSHDSDTEVELVEMRENFMPILEAGGVDLTLTGHSHIYERSMLMDGAYATPTVAEGVILNDGDGSPEGDGAYQKSEGIHPNEGSVSIVAGHGGADISRRGTMPVMREIILEHGSVILDIKGDTLTGVMLDKHGATRDLFSIVKKGTVTPKRIEHPWQPENDLSQLTRLLFNFAGDKPGVAPAHWRMAAGDGGKLTVMGEEGSKRRSLRVDTGTSPVIGLLEAPQVDLFEYETFLRLPGDGAKSAGLVFGYTNERNFWQVLVDGNAGVVRVTRVIDGTAKVLVEQDAKIDLDKWLKLKLECEGKYIEVLFENGVEFTFEPGEALPNAHLGFVAPGPGPVDFMAFQIRR